MVMTSVNRMIPPSTNIAQAYANAGDAGQELVLNLALFLANFLSTHLRVVETEQNRDVLLNAHLYMVKISQVDEREVFKTGDLCEGEVGPPATICRATSRFDVQILGEPHRNGTIEIVSRFSYTEK